ncbi:hypothetical protein Tco_1290801 [Tanacetum coccineum]
MNFVGWRREGVSATWREVDCEIERMVVLQRGWGVFRCVGSEIVGEEQSGLSILLLATPNTHNALSAKSTALESEYYNTPIGPLPDNHAQAIPSTKKSLTPSYHHKFVQVFLDKQVGDMSTHDEIFVTPSHTKKVFGNMKKVRKGFSGAVTPLFPTMMVQAQEEMGEEPIADEAATKENVPTQSNDPPLLRVNTLGSGEDILTLKELMDLCTKLSNRVLDLETTKTAQAKEIADLKKRVKKLERKRKSKLEG